MSDPVIDNLAKFTPTSRLDRDELIFRAGRASAPGRRWWMALAGLLAVGQVTTLTLWYTQSRPVEVFGNNPPTTVADDYHYEPRPDPDSYGSLRANWDGDTLPTPTSDPAPSGPSLSVLSAWTDPEFK